MAHIFVALSEAAGAGGNYTPELSYRDIVNNTKTAITIPRNVGIMNVRPCMFSFRGNVYILGTFSPGLIVTSELLAYPLGIAKPPLAPSISIGSGTQTTIAYLTYAHKKGSGVVVHESAPSYPTETEDTNTSRVWTLPTVSADDRVTHVRGWVSLDGASARRSFEVAIGTTTVTESVATLALGEQLSTGGGVPPYAKYGAVYHERVWYAVGNKIYYSDVGKGESVASSNYFYTKTREDVTGMATVRDMLVVFCANSINVIQGFTADDFQIRLVSPSIGCISHHSIVNIHDRLWFASQLGVYVFDGSFSFVMDHLRQYWRDDYDANKSSYENCFAHDDRQESCYVLTIPKSTSPYTFKYYGYYVPFEPSAGGAGGQPWWFFQTRTRVDTASGILAEDGTNRYVPVTGSSDGYVRQENDYTDYDDDGDSYAKAMTITTGIRFINEVGGDIQDGKEFHEIWSFIEAENNSWVIKGFGGDESALDQATGAWTATEVASLYTSGTETWVAKTQHWHLPERLVGRGLALEYTVSSPNGVIWRGFGGTKGPGPTYRGKA